MEHIEQLKKIRADAITRLRASDDFKLAGKLGLLIVELGETVDDTIDYGQSRSAMSPLSKAVLASTATTKPPEPHPFEKAFSKTADEDTPDDADSEEGIQELVAEIEEDAAELNALAADVAVKKNVADKKVGPFLSPQVSNNGYANGASH